MSSGDFREVDTMRRLCISEIDVPKEVTDAALFVEMWFKKRGCDDWQLMGICSRKYAFELEHCRASLIKLSRISRESITKMSEAFNEHFDKMNYPE